MKSRIAAALAISFVAAFVFAQERLPDAESAIQTPLPPNVPVEAKHYSYAIGLDLGISFRSDDIELDVESLLAGIRDGLQQAEPKFPPQLCGAAMQKLDGMRLDALRKRNENFLIENRTAQGVETLPNGLQYQVLKTGEGDVSPQPTDTVRVHYRGQRIDGSVFDQSIGGEPAEFRLDEVIPGWGLALAKMHQGDRWRLFIPSELAYGADGFGGLIAPYSTLIFEVELIEIR